MKELYAMITAGLILVILGISLSIGAKVTENVRDNMPVNTTAWDAAQNSTLAINDLSTWQSTISTVVAAVIIIGLLLSGFGAFLYFKAGKE